ncbi:MAG: CPBP family intramembrane metalloprotease [Chloroflexi bacterium]|nr:CPBP family intramembrane metalloprotease [Chloroflexota bacterium]
MVTKELEEIGLFLRRNYSELIIISCAALFLILGEHHSLVSRWFDAVVFYAILPLLAIFILLRKNPLDFGLRPGDYRIWLVHVIVTCIVAFPILIIASRFNSLQDYYTIEDFFLPRYFLEITAYQISWEFIFRGFLLFGLKEKLKEVSIIVQMVPFVLLHLGKPEIEVISTIPMGIYFGYIAYRGNSYWPAVIIHLFINISFRVMVNGF